MDSDGTVTFKKNSGGDGWMRPDDFDWNARADLESAACLVRQGGNNVDVYPCLEIVLFG